MKYLDFIIHFEPLENKVFRLRATSIAGDASLELTGEESWFLGTPNPRSLRDVGSSLHRAVFKEDILGLWAASKARANERGWGLRIKLKMDVTHPDIARLANLPWEYMGRDNQYLALDEKISIVRHMNTPRPLQSCVLSLPLNVLVVACSPSGQEELNIAQAKTRIEKALDKKGVSLDFLTGDLEDLRCKLLEKQYHIFHFIGHGGFLPRRGKGVLFFEKKDRKPDEVSGEDLAALLKQHSSLKLVVLDACNTAQINSQKGMNPFAGVAGALTASGATTVIAFSHPIDDDVSICFVQTLYQRLAEWDSLETAISRARLAIHAQNRGALEWGIPVLFMRSPDNDGDSVVIFRPPTWPKWMLAVAVILMILGGIWLAQGDPYLDIALEFKPGSNGSERFDALIDSKMNLITELSNLTTDPPIRIIGTHCESLTQSIVDQADVLVTVEIPDSGPVFSTTIQRKKGKTVSFEIFKSKGFYDELPRLQLSLLTKLIADLNLTCPDSEREKLDGRLNGTEKGLALHREGVSLLLKRKPEEAIKKFQDSIEIDPDLGVVHGHLGLALMETGHLEEAVISLEKAVSLFPKVAVFQYNLGSGYHQLGEDNKALPCLEEAIRLDPTFGKAYNQMGNIYLISRQYKKAAERFERGLEKEPRSPQLLKNLGWAYVEMNRAKEARSLLITAGECYPINNIAGRVETLFWLTRALRDLGENEKGCQKLSILRDLDEANIFYTKTQIDDLAASLSCGTEVVK